jgi:predicted DNA-binding protein (MmcQ/YjbR family)
MNIEFIRETCLRLPAVTEDVKWGHDLVFSVGDKMFCVVGLDQTPTTATFKVKDEEFDEISSRSGFKPAPYLARYKWVMVEDSAMMDKKEWESRIKGSYVLVKDKLPLRIKKMLGL